MKFLRPTLYFFLLSTFAFNAYAVGDVSDASNDEQVRGEANQCAANVLGTDPSTVDSDKFKEELSEMYTMLDAHVGDDEVRRVRDRQNFAEQSGRLVINAHNCLLAAGVDDFQASSAHFNFDSIVSADRCIDPDNNKQVTTNGVANQARAACKSKAAFNLEMRTNQQTRSAQQEQNTTSGRVDPRQFASLKEKTSMFVSQLEGNGITIVNGGQNCKAVFGADIDLSSQTYEDVGESNVNFSKFYNTYKDSGELNSNIQVKNAIKCVSGQLQIGQVILPAPFKAKDSYESYYEQPMFTKMSVGSLREQIGTFGNIKNTTARFCMDHARIYCQPYLEYFRKCEGFSDAGAKKNCKSIAYKKFLDCAGTTNNRNLYTANEFKLPAEVVTANANLNEETYKNSPPAGGTDAQAQQRDLQALRGEIESNPNSQTLMMAYRTFGGGDDSFDLAAEHDEIAKFHDFYGQCVLYREAAKKNRDGGEVPVGERVTSVRGINSCKLETPWTADYKFCNRAIVWVDGFSDILSVGTNMVMDVRAVQQAEDATQDAAMATMEGDPTGAMILQEQELKSRSDKHLANAAIDMTTAAGSFYGWIAYPGPKRLEDTCNGSGAGEFVYGSQAVDCGMLNAYNRRWIEPGGEDDNFDSLFPNNGLKNLLMTKMIQKFGSGMYNAIVGRSLAKQAGQVNALREGFQDFYDEPSMAFGEGQAAPPGYCAQNPTVPSCRGNRRGGQVQGGLGFNGANVGGGQGGNSLNFGSDSTGEFVGEEEISQNKRRAIDDLKGIIGNTKRNKFGNDLNAPGAAKASAGGGGGGGSISGSAGGGGGGGGGGAGGAGGGGAGPSQAGPSKSKISYNAGGNIKGPKFAAGGSTSKKSKSKNPFSNMFGKKNRKVASNVVNDIAPKKSKLFEKISKAYSKANSKNLLIKMKTDE